MKVTVSGNINVDGQWWTTTVEIDLGEVTPAVGLKLVRKKIAALSRQGWISTIPDPGARLTGPGPQEIKPMAEAVVMAPSCPRHGEMKKSQYQKKDGIIMWYCPAKEDGEYCVAKVKQSINTGQMQTI